MKIKITTDRMPWANERPHPIDAEIDVQDQDGALLIELGHAVEIPAARKAAK